MIKKILIKLLPLKILQIILTFKHILNNYQTILKFAELERKILKNVELDDAEYRGFEKYLNNVPEEKHCYVDIGAADGVNSSSTLKLLKDRRWTGVCFEYGPLTKISYAYRNFKNVKLCQIKVTPKNISNLFNSYDIDKNFGFLNLDIDSYDLPVMEEILKSGYKPCIVSMEINEKIPPPIEFFVYFDDQFKSSGNHFYGCSITSAAKLMEQNGYILKHLQGNNALFLNRKYFNLKNKNVHDAYKEGYINLKNRKNIFWYNDDMEELLNYEIEGAISFINTKFKNYEGKYYINY